MRSSLLLGVVAIVSALAGCGDDSSAGTTSGDGGSSSSSPIAGVGGAGGDTGSGLPVGSGGAPSGTGGAPTGTGGGPTGTGGAGGSGGAPPEGNVLLELLGRRYFPETFQTDAEVTLSVRITNVGIDEPMGVGSSTYSFNQDGVIRDAINSDNVETPCEESVSLAMGGSYECELAFAVDAADGKGGILLYADPTSGASGDLVIPDMVTDYFEQCMTHFNNEIQDECEYCLIGSHQDECLEPYGRWSNDCQCPPDQSSSSGAVGGPSQRCCESMDFNDQCAFSPALVTCLTKRCAVECSLPSEF